MNVLLIGGPGSFTNAMIAKLNKEGHRVFLLSGKENSKKDYQGKIFALYAFNYDNVYMKYIFESANPDVVIHMGALDNNFTWEDELADASSYSSGLTMLLSVFHSQNKGRFIYLSSFEVFGGTHTEAVVEETRPNGKSVRAVSLISSENIVRSYAEAGDDAVILRVDNLCHVPNDTSDLQDRISQLCYRAMKDTEVESYPNRDYSVISEPDAIEFIYRIVVAEKYEYSLYNLTSTEIVNDKEIVEYITGNQLVSAGNIEMNDQDPVYLVMSGARFNKEFDVHFKCSHKSIIDKTLERMAAKPKAFELKDKEESSFERFINKSQWIIRKAVPYFESLLAAGLVYLIQRYGLVGQYIEKLDIYLIYVLLFSIVYGQNPAVFSGIMAVVVYFITQLQQRTGMQIMSDYNTYVWMAQLFILGLVVGYMRDQLKKQKEESQERNRYLSERIDDIQIINDSNVRVKESLETQVINQSDTIGKLYKITSSLNQYSEEEVLFYAAEIVEQLMNTHDVAIYVTGSDGYSRLFTATSDISRSLGNSIKSSEYAEIFEVLEHHGVYINKEMKKEYPMMASGVYSGDRLQSVIFVWNVPWENMTLSQANLLTVTGLMIRDFVDRAKKYMARMEYRRYAENCHIMEVEAFETKRAAFQSAAARHLTEYRLLEIKEKIAFTAEDYERLDGLLRQTDNIGYNRDGKLIVLLANSDDEARNAVSARLLENGFNNKALAEK